MEVIYVCNKIENFVKNIQKIELCNHIGMEESVSSSMGELTNKEGQWKRNQSFL